MKEIKVILSPSFSGEEYVEVVSGLTFEKTRNIEVHTINLEEHKLSGIQSALRKNILLPYGRDTREFMTQNVFSEEKVAATPDKEEEKVPEAPQAPVEPAKEEEVEPVAEEVKEAPKKKAAPKKSAKKTKKED